MHLESLPDFGPELLTNPKESDREITVARIGDHNVIPVRS